ncbi:hypothetical protein CFRS1_v001317 [Colletotrichum fructicola]|nr:hypothetical protein CFRS1_v001317 [Colletotrichum fructicola]
MLENEGLWKDHLAADVNPYTCIAKDCPRPHVLYRVTGQLDSPVLIRHILEHIHDFSLRSLPWADMPIEYEQGSTASEQWAQAESALNDLTLRRSVHKGVGNEGCFSRNDYFATDSGHVSLDVKLDESPSLRSYDSDFNFGSEHHEDAAAEMFEGNTKSEDKEDGRQNTKDIV